jgi:2,3-bisphosphoglycerate-independent phosphoglycerate mutase
LKKQEGENVDISKAWEGLIREKGGKIVYLVLDGVGGLPDPQRGGTELQAAATPNLDRLAEESACGLLETVGPGITPGSGPGHLALFGYDPFQYNTGRGVLAALGVDFDLREGDVAARVNFATMDGDGRITDRRAGRIDTATNRRLCKRIREELTLDMDVEYFLRPVSEHRAVLVLRAPGLGGRLKDTDPQKTGKSPFDPEPLDQDSRKTAGAAKAFLDGARTILSGEEHANMVLLRGFDRYNPLTSLESRFGLHGICIAQYPMYRGVSRLLGMAVHPAPENLETSFDTLQRLYKEDFDFFFLHAKKTDAAGEDGRFDRKTEVIESLDALVPVVANTVEDVLVVTADHSTPSRMANHSWHPVPVMIRARHARLDDVKAFHEAACLRGSLGMRPGLHLMGLALAHAGRLRKYGA